MYNLLRKSIIVISLILLTYSCKTVGEETTQVTEPVSYNLETLFPKGRESFVFIDLNKNRYLIESLGNSIGLKSTEKKIISNSSEIYLAFNEDPVESFDLIVKGDFSKIKYDLGLFFSLSWKRDKEDGRGFWLSRDGIKLSVIDNSTIVITTDKIAGLIDILSLKHSIEIIDSAFLLYVPVVNDKLLTDLTRGFLKGGVDRATVDLEKSNSDYVTKVELGVESDRKAKALSRLLSIFIKIAIIGSDDPIIAKIGRDLEIEYENSSVFLKNITLTEKKLEEILNNLLVNRGEADK